MLALDIPREQKATLFATMARINALSMIAEASSGHIGASFSSADILTWLYLYEMKPKDVVILSRGHEVPIWYAIQHGLGHLSDAALHTFRQPNGLPGHPEVSTPGVECNTGSLGMGISKAIGMILADRLADTKRRYYVLVGDGELQEGQNWEAIRQAGELNLHELTVLVDINGYQSDRPTLVLNTGSALHAHFWCVTHCVQGHDFQQIANAFLRTRIWSNLCPSVITAQTTKGKGISFMEGHHAEKDGIYQWHSGAPTAEQYEDAIRELAMGQWPYDSKTGLHNLWFEYDLPDNECPCERIIEIPHEFKTKQPDSLLEAYGQALVELGERTPQLVVLDADLSVDCGLEPFRARFPERFIECGISEQSMVSIASGLALRGYLPVVHSFARFLVHRAQDQIMNQIEEGSKVIYVGSMAGQLPTPGPGKCHQTTVDAEFMDRIGCVVLETRTPEDVKKVVLSFPLFTDSVYLRILTKVARQ